MELQDKRPGLAAPSIADAVAYVAAGGIGSTDGYLYAVDIETGQEKWTFKTKGGLDNTPAIAGGVVYIRDHEGILCACWQPAKVGQSTAARLADQGERRSGKGRRLPA